MALTSNDRRVLNDELHFRQCPACDHAGLDTTRQFGKRTSCKGCGQPLAVDFILYDKTSYGRTFRAAEIVSLIPVAA